MSCDPDSVRNIAPFRYLTAEIQLSNFETYKDQLHRPIFQTLGSSCRCRPVVIKLIRFFIATDTNNKSGRQKNRQRFHTVIGDRKRAAR